MHPLAQERQTLMKERDKLLSRLSSGLYNKDQKRAAHKEAAEINEQIQDLDQYIFKEKQAGRIFKHRSYECAPRPY